jgi:hypothetical protein
MSPLARGGSPTERLTTMRLVAALVWLTTGCSRDEEPFAFVAAARSTGLAVRERVCGRRLYAA